MLTIFIPANSINSDADLYPSVARQSRSHKTVGVQDTHARLAGAINSTDNYTEEDSLRL